MPLYEDSEILSSFRSMPFEPSVARKRSTHGMPMSAADLTDAFLKKLATMQASPVANLTKHWHECLPKKLIGSCAPTHIRGGILYAVAPNPQIRQELQFSVRKILTKVKKVDGCDNIKSIRFV